jgi:hypothetical protein
MGLNIKHSIKWSVPVTGGVWEIMRSIAKSLRSHIMISSLKDTNSDKKNLQQVPQETDPPRKALEWCDYSLSVAQVWPEPQFVP